MENEDGAESGREFARAEFDGMTFRSGREVSSAFLDSSVRMGIAQSVLMVQDNLTECFGKLGCDGIVFREAYRAFWVFTKTKIHFARRPAWREKIFAETFPVDNRGFKAHVNTLLTDSAGATLLTANQEACVLDMATHRPVKLSALPFPADNFPPPVFSGEFEKFGFPFSEDNFKYAQIVRSQHIDMSRHMNNIEYIKLALNVFSDEFLRTHEAVSLEVHYTGESREGQELRVYAAARTDTAKHGDATAAAAETTDIAIKEGEGGRSVFEMRVVFSGAAGA